MPVVGLFLDPKKRSCKSRRTSRICENFLHEIKYTNVPFPAGFFLYRHSLLPPCLQESVARHRKAKPRYGAALVRLRMIVKLAFWREEGSISSSLLKRSPNSNSARTKSVSSCRPVSHKLRLVKIC